MGVDYTIMLRTVSALGRHPRDHLVGIHDVARLAVDAVRRVDLQAHRLAGLADDLVDVRRAEADAGVTM